MARADDRTGRKKPKAHLGFDLNRGIPTKIFLSDGSGVERPFVTQILESGQTGVMDRGYHCHKNFDLLQDENKHFVCRIKGNTKRTELTQHALVPGSIIFYDALVLPGRPGG